jgi:hypothetical protein
MLQRGQTTEERIAQIAQGFGQGAQNFIQGQDRQRAQGLQAEATRRQQAMQELEIEGKLSEQTGKNLVGSGIGKQYLMGGMAGIGELMNSAPTSRKAEQENLKLQRENEKYSQDQEKYNYDARQRSLPPEQRDSFKEGMAIASARAQTTADVAANKVTPDMRKVATFATRVRQAENDFSEIEKNGYRRADIGSGIESSLPPLMQGEFTRRQEQAERNFTNSVLRRESGSAIGSAEFDSAAKQYFPRPGDTKEVLLQKKRNRETVIRGLESEAGERAMSGQGALPRGVNGSWSQDNVQTVKAMSDEELLKFVQGA